MLDTFPSDSLPLTQIARQLPGSRGAKRLHPATLTRWILTGCKATDGTVVRLRAIRCGHRWLVRPAELNEFFTILPGPSPPVATTRPHAQRRRAAERAAAALEKLGA